MNRKDKINFLHGLLSGKNIASLTEPDLSKSEAYLISESSDVVTVLLHDGRTEEITVQELDEIERNSKAQWITFE